MNKEILKRYFEGLSGRWEKKQVQEYLEGDDLQVFDEYIREQKENKNREGFADDSYKNDFYKELTCRIKEIENSGKVRQMSGFKPLLKIAASIMLVSSISGFLYLKIKQQSKNISRTLTSINNNTRNLKEVELKDGTKIWMNPGTKLAYDPQGFGDTARQVSITGEAYFNVAHDKARPFRVKAGGITTTVLGTTFNVEAYTNEQDVRVMLVTGHVRINSATGTAILFPGQMLKYSHHNKTMKISLVDVSDKQELYTSGKLVFENLPLNDVLKRLERVFNVKISAVDTNILTNKRISGAYFRDNPETALNRILFIHGLHYNKKGEDKYVIIK